MPRVKSFKVRRGVSIAGHTVLECLGRGWEGEVYRVSEEYSNGHRVLKLFDRALYRSKQLYDFCPKLERMSSVPGIIRFYHAGYWEDHDCYYLVMESLNGKPLDRMISKRKLPLFKALRLMRDLLHAVNDCHKVGFCVGDIHAGNIIVTENDRPYIIDVDLTAKLNSRTAEEDRANVCRLFYDITDGPYPRDLRSAFPKRKDALANRYKHTVDMLDALHVLMGREP